MDVWTLIFAIAASTAASADVSGDYQAVTETEYAIDLTLQKSGQARLIFRTWEADGSATPSTKIFTGAWSRSGTIIALKLESGQSARFRANECLPYAEFGQTGCSYGLSLVSTTLPKRYGLQRFGLWRSESLRVQR